MTPPLHQPAVSVECVCWKGNGGEAGSTARTTQQQSASKPHCRVCVAGKLAARHISPNLQEASDHRDVSELTQQERNNLALVEVKRMNDARPDRRMWEVFTAAQAVKTPFSVEGGTLTQTLKLRRSAVAEQYSDDLESLWDRIR